MADQKESKERKIPVFSVWKNNAILKNIFLVNAPPFLDDIPAQTGDKIGENGKIHLEFEETLVIGRHPDCDIRLEHPSISRFHLRIHSKPSSLHLSLTDLSSVHGTWVSGRRIEPNVKTILKECDTLRIGGSSRVYKLHWIPLTQAYDMEHPFVPPLDFPEPQEDEEEEIFKDENSPGLKNVDVNVDSSVMCDDNEFMVEESNVNEDTNSVDSDFDGLESLFGDADNDAFVQKGSSPANSVQNRNSVVLENKDELEFDSILDGLLPLFLGENWEWAGQEENHLECPQVDNSPLPFKHEDEGLVASVLKGSDAFLDENSELLVHKIIPSAPPLLENMTFDLALKFNNSIADGKGGNELLDETNQANGKQNPLQEDVQESTWNFWDGSLVKNCHLDNRYPKHESEPIVSSHRKLSTKEHEAGTLWSFWSGNMGIESVCSSLSHVDGFSESENESLRNGYQSPLSSVKKQLGSSLITPEQNSVHSIWSRRGKQENAPQVLTSRTEGKKIKTAQKNVKHDPISRALFHGVDDQEEEEIVTPDKENLTPSTHRSMRKLAVLSEVKCLNSGKSSLLHGVDDQEEEEIFTPDKENLTPNTHKSMRKLAVLGEVKRSNSRKSSHFKMPCSSDIFYEDGMSPASDKEQKTLWRSQLNQAQTVKPKQRKAERLPFQTLLADSPQMSMPETCFLDAAMISGNSVSFAKATSKDKCSGGRIQSWKMVVDTTTLLNKESRKALQLLEGLKGTQLIIPRIVIRELDCLKRQVSFFRRKSEVSSALEWVQDCMMKTQRWIHIQSSVEEGWPVAPTPPASPQSQFSCGTVSSVPFLGGSRTELLSPTAEDHVLDYAISFWKTMDDGQLVLLSNNVTLKIKAMAEGLICEEAEEFRKSLVNPFSERFLWTDSSPRGQTWSCSDDIVLQEKFYPSSLKMTPKSMENVKGLKLILLHNSQYFERMTAIHYD